MLVCIQCTQRHNVLKHFSALVLASPEIRFQVDSETMDPIDVQAKKLFETNSMVEEFMLLANISVAEKILAEFPDCAMLRRHPEPPMSNFDPLVKAARHLVRYSVMCSSSGRHIMVLLCCRVSTLRATAARNWQHRWTRQCVLTTRT